MKKPLLFLFSFLCITTLLFAQTKIYTKPTKTTLQKTIGQEPPPTPAVTKTTGTETNTSTPPSTYTLTSARVSITTGADNKEFPSPIYLELWIKNRPGFNYANDCLFKIGDLKNEMKVNSSTEVGLEYYGSNPDKYSLSGLQQTGLTFTVGYLPNWFTDAWRIEGVTLTLEFKDQNGNLHPTFGSKTIVFKNAVGFLNAEYKMLICTTDQNFDPLIASIEKK